MIKVQITDKVGAIFQDGVKHLPGDIIEIPAKSFRPDHYKKIEPETPKKTAPAKPAETDKTEEPPAAAELLGVPIVLKKETSDEEKAETAEKAEKAQRKKTA